MPTIYFLCQEKRTKFIFLDKYAKVYAMSYAAISIGLFIFLVAYFTLNAPVQAPVAPTPPPQVAEATQYCQTVDAGTAPTFKAPRDDVSKLGYDDQDRSTGTLVRDKEGCGGDRHLLKGETTYRLLRKNVPMSTTDVKKRDFNWDDGSCHFDTAGKLGINIPEVDTTKYKVFFPEISGEISIDRLLESRTRGGERDLLYFIDYGLVFLLHINPDGSLTELKGGTTQGQAETFVLADVYQDIDSGRPDLPAEALACDTTKGSKIASGGSQVTVPSQENSSDPDQLQLKYFVFTTQQAGSGPVVNGWGIHCKPAVYLYPPKKQLVNVKVIPSGFLTYTDPPYDPDKGWTVNAFPGGELFTMNHKPITNNYLYFESKIRDEVIEKPTRGWVVKYEDLTNLYQNILPKLGLNEQQKNDFIEYWNKALSKDPAPYYFVGVIDQSNVDQIERLEITPKPDSVNRVRIYFERLNEPKQVQEPSDIGLQQSTSPEKAESRKLRAESEFKVVEWGGMVKNDPDHPFTCSQ